MAVAGTRGVIEVFKRYRSLTFLLAAGVLVAGAYLLRDPLFGGLLERTAAEHLARALNVRAKVQGLSWSLFGGVRCDRIAGVATDPRPVLRAFRMKDVFLRLHYLRLLRGDASGAELYGRSGSLDLDLDRPGREKKAAPAGPPSFNAPAHLPVLRLEMCTLSVRRAGRELLLDPCTVTLASPGPSGEQAGRIAVKHVVLSGPLGEERWRDLTCPLTYREAHLTVGPLHAAGGPDLFRADVEGPERENHALAFRLQAAPFGGRLRLQGRLILAKALPLSASLDGEALNIAAAAEWAAWITGASLPARGSLAVHGTFQGRLADPASVKMQSGIRIDRAGYGESPDFDGELSVAWRGGDLEVARAELASRDGRVTLAGARLTRDAHGLEVTLDTLEGRVRGVEVALGKPAHVRLEPGGAFRIAPVSLDVAGGRVDLEGRIAEDGSARWSAEVRGMEPEVLHRLLPSGGPMDRVTWQGLHLIADGEGPLTRPRVNLDLSLDHLQPTAEVAIEDVLLKARLAPPRLIVDPCAFRFKEGGGVRLHARGTLQEKTPFSMPPSYRVEATLEGVPLSLLAGLGVPLDGLDGTLDAAAGMSADSGLPSAHVEWHARARGFPRALAAALPPPPPGPPAPWSFEGACRFAPEGLIVDSFRVESPLGAVSAAGTAPVHPAGSGAALFRPVLDRASPVRARVECSGVTLRRLIPGAAAPSGTLEATVDLSGSVAQPRAGFSLAVQDLQVPGLPGHDLTVEGALLDRSVRVERLDLARGGAPVLRGTLSLGLAGTVDSGIGLPGPDSPFHADLSVTKADLSPYAEAFAIPVQGKASLSLRGRGTLEHPEVEAAFQVEEGRIPLAPPAGEAGVSAGATPAEPLSFRLSGRTRIDDRGLVVEGVTVESPEGLNLAGSGVFPLRLAWSQLRSGRLMDPGAVLSGTLEARGVDLALVERAVPGVRRMAGHLDLSAEIGGSAADPHWKGRLDLRQGALRLEGNLPTLAELEAAVTVDREGVRVEKVEGLLGGGPFLLEGRVDWEAFRPRYLDLLLRGDHCLLARQRGVRVRGDLDVSVKGPVSKPKVTGEVALVDTRVTRRIPLLPGKGPPAVDREFHPFELTGPVLGDVVFDLPIRARSEHPLSVANNLARGDVEADLRLRGTGRVPYFTGEARFNGMRLQLPNFTFHVDTGRLVFLEEDPFVPRLELSAHGRSQGYDVDLQVRGPVTEPVVTLTSVPALDEDSLVVLVATGSLPEHVRARGTRSEALYQLGKYLGEELYFNLLGNESTETGETILDRFEFTVGTEVGRDGTDNYILEYRLTPKWFLQLERDVYTHMNVGVVYRIRFR